jgi:hypothetical protein
MLLDPYRFASPATDPNFSSVVLLLHADGVNGGTTFTDSSSYARSPTSVVATTTSTTESKFGGSSGRFAGGGSSGISYSDSADFTLGTSNFTLEMWVRFDDTGTRRLLCGQSDASGTNASISVAFERTSGNKIRGFCCSGSSAIGDVTGTTNVSANTWYHVAYVRDGSTFRLFLAGAAEGTATSSSSVNNSTQNFSVGALGIISSNTFVGYIDDFRYTIGVARYTGAFTPPTVAFPNSA